MDVNKNYSVAIRPISPWRNVLKGFSEVRDFGKIWKASHPYRIHIIQIGAGGTGGYVAGQILRYLSNLPSEIQDVIYYTLCDGDTFEDKNLNRQLCTVEDVGKNKASTIVSAYGELYGCKSSNIFAYPHYITSHKQLQELSNGLPTPVMNGIYIPHHYQKYVYSESLTQQKYQDIPIDVTCQLYYGCMTPVNGFKDPECLYFPDFDVEGVETALDTVESYQDEIPKACLNTTAKVIPIIIDCVDKTEVRNIVHQTLQGLFTALPDFNETLKSKGILELAHRGNTSYEKSHLLTGISKKKGYVYSDDTDPHLYFVAPNNIVVSTKHGDKDALSWLSINARLSRYIFSPSVFDAGNRKVEELGNYNVDSCNRDTIERCNELKALIANKDSDIVTSSDYNLLENRCFITDCYLISSGNSEFSGQVGWGRYSMYLPCNTYINSITFLDVFKDPNVKGTLTFKDNKDKVLSSFTDLCPDGWADKFYSKREYSDQVPNGGIEAYTYKLYRRLKIKGIDLGSINFDDPTKSNIYQNSLGRYMTGVYYSNMVLDTANNPSEIFESIKILGGFNSRNVNFPEFDYLQDFMALSNVRHDNPGLNCLRKNMIFKHTTFIHKASDGTTIPFKDIFKNKQEWLSQYISVPTPYMLHPELIDYREDDKEEQMSCAERAVTNIQSINANYTAANLVMNYFTEIMNGLLSLKSEGPGITKLSNCCTSFDTRTNTFVTTPITTDLLVQYDSNFKSETMDPFLYSAGALKLRSIWENREFSGDPNKEKGHKPDDLIIHIRDLEAESESEAAPAENISTGPTQNFVTGLTTDEVHEMTERNNRTIFGIQDEEYAPF